MKWKEYSKSKYKYMKWKTNFIYAHTISNKAGNYAEKESKEAKQRLKVHFSHKHFAESINKIVSMYNRKLNSYNKLMQHRIYGTSKIMPEF